MQFDPPLIQGTLVKRYKRFFADVQLADGSVVTAHSPNTGSMKGCSEPGSPVAISIAAGKARKLPYTWELVRCGEAWVSVHTGRTNGFVAEAIQAGAIPELAGYDEIRREVPYGAERSRIDLLLTKGARPCFVEVKNVTLREGEVAMFPDAVTIRGAKHLRELTRLAEEGVRAVIFFLVARGDCRAFSAAVGIDPSYATALETAHTSGVEILVYAACVSPAGISLSGRIPWQAKVGA